MKTTAAEQFQCSWNSPAKILWTDKGEKVSVKEFFADTAEKGDVALQQFTKENTGDNRPMFWVNYDEALEFCDRLTKRERAAGRLPAGYKYTLPTEAQWAYAFRSEIGGTVRREYLDSQEWFEKNQGWAMRAGVTNILKEWSFSDVFGDVRKYCSDLRDLCSNLDDLYSMMKKTGRVVKGIVGCAFFALTLFGKSLMDWVDDCLVPDCLMSLKPLNYLGFRVALSPVELSGE